jgi:hypothetical protein
MKFSVFIATIAIAVSSCVQTAPRHTTEFVTQILEPTGGKVQRPKDWFYTESHNSYSYTWILSREDASKAAYTTGVRIQLIEGVKRRTGKTPKEFIEDFVRTKKQSADKVLNMCDESSQGMFSRICLETEEGPHHILYSLFWGNDGLDIAGATIAGTKKELWDDYAPIFNAMSQVELIDMSRFTK